MLSNSSKGRVVGILVVLALGLSYFWLTRKNPIQVPVGAHLGEAVETNRIDGNSQVQRDAVAHRDQVTTSQASALVTTSYSPETQRRIHVLEEVLSSRNDNDRRLDTEFKNMSVELKGALAQKYLQFPLEQRNHRGTVVFLVGRELKTEEDWSFIRQVVAEKRCRSLEDCSRDTVAHAGDADEGHVEAGSEVTLAYPQLVALKSVERLVPEGGFERLEGRVREQILAVLAVARSSDDPRVAAKAMELEARWVPSR